MTTDNQPQVTPATAPAEAFSLSLPPVEVIAEEAGISLAPPAVSPPAADASVTQTAAQTEPTVDEDRELAQMADQFVSMVMRAREESRQNQRQAVDEMGIEVQRQSAHYSKMLQTPIRQLAHQADEDAPVAQALVDLRDKMQVLDPERNNLSDSPITRALSFIPGVGNALQRYFRKFENSQQALDGIIKNLEGGSDILRRDNVTLSDDQQAFRNLTVQLKRQIALGRMIDRRLTASTAALPQDDSQHSFLEEELLFPLRQRIIDLQQQLAVNQQGVLALEVIIRNNRELIRGVDRAIHVTVSALNVAVTVALALANQKLVLDRVEALNSTTSSLIAGTAKALRSQGVDIQNRASSTVLNMDQLKQAFGDVIGAIDEVSRYRREALPRLDAQIDALEKMSAQGDDAIVHMERGNTAQSQTSI